MLEILTIIGNLLTNLILIILGIFMMYTGYVLLIEVKNGGKQQ